MLWNLIQGRYRCNKILRSDIGITLIEILVAVTLLSIIVFPLFMSMTTASKANSDAEGTDLAAFYAIGKMEEVLAMDFSAVALSSPAGTPLPPPISDTVNIKGRSVNRNVYAELFDGNGDSVPDVGLKKITVSVGDFSISTLKADYPYATF